MPFLAVDHPAIACYDVERQVAWYCQTLGMRVVSHNGQAPPAAVVGYDEGTRGGAMIELMPVRDEGPRPADEPRFKPGLRHLAFRVGDFDAACDRLRAAGVAFLGPEGVAIGGGRVVSFRDPEGNELQIVER